MFFHLFQAFFEDVKCCRAEVQTQARDVIFKLFLVTFFFFFPRPRQTWSKCFELLCFGSGFPLEANFKHISWAGAVVRVIKVSRRTVWSPASEIVFNSLTCPSFSSVTLISYLPLFFPLSLSLSFNQ